MLLVSVVSKLGPARVLSPDVNGNGGTNGVTNTEIDCHETHWSSVPSFSRLLRQSVAGVVLVGLIPWRLVAAEPKYGPPPLPEAGLAPEKATASVVAAKPDTVIVVEPARGVQFFCLGDSISITAVKATSPHLRAGDKVVVKGHYTLSSRPKAALCLFATATKGSGKGPIRPEQKLAITKGDGDFELSETLEGDGYLHLTFYSVPQGKPFGGMYFGTAKQMKEIEHWAVKNWYTAK